MCMSMCVYIYIYIHIIHEYIQPSAEDLKEGTGALVPFADMLNHRRTRGEDVRRYGDPPNKLSDNREAPPRSFLRSDLSVAGISA